jgi:aryl-alcohol dehydrogenase-like predicted oxidoreductase
MKYRKLGNSGLIVSAMGLGSMQFGRAMNMGRLDQAATTRLVRLALDRGVNLIDTADVYSRGESETLIGAALEGVRDQVVLATKVRLPMSDDDVNRSGAHRVNIIRGIDESLSRLRTDHVDLYQLHGWDSNTPLEETLRAMDDIVRQGKVRYIGLSNYLAWQAATALGIQRQQSLATFITAQMYYSLVGRELEHEWTSLASYTGLGIIVWSPLAGGFLSGKYSRESAPRPGTRYAEAGQFVPFDRDKGERVMGVVKQIATRHGVSAARVALAWTLSRPTVSAVLVAARTPEHLEDNLSAIDLQLSPEDLQALNGVSDPGVPYPKWMVLQLDQAEDPRSRILDPEAFARSGPWRDLRRAPTQDSSGASSDSALPGRR